MSPFARLVIASFFFVACGVSSPTLMSDATIVDASVDSSASVDMVACTLVSPYSSSDPTCNGCAEQKCCVEVNGCVGNTKCNDDYVDCTIGCVLIAPPDGGITDAGIYDCLADCATQYPEGKAAYDVAIGCVEKRCPDVCQ